MLIPSVSCSTISINIVDRASAHITHQFHEKNNFDGVDPTGYFFQRIQTYQKTITPTSSNGEHLIGLGISGTGVRNNFTTSDKTVRTAGIQYIKDSGRGCVPLGGAGLASILRHADQKHDLA